ncbi:MAG: hypothetical protein RLZZ455_645 [Candidatus Parcubacteria bacterium]|jgi:Zn-dependent protease
MIDPFLIITLLVLIFSAILHEIAHGLVADRLGDPTARLLGRLTLDPRPHIDPIMSLLLPLMLLISGSPIILGGAKPVPVDPFNLKEGRKDLALVSLAGPLTNICIAVIGALLFHLTFNILATDQATAGGLFVLRLLKTIVSINILLAVFNLIPIPPLDGSKIFSLILPEKTAATYLSIGSLGAGLLLFLLFLPTGLSELIGTLYNFGLSLLGF